MIPNGLGKKFMYYGDSNLYGYVDIDDRWARLLANENNGLDWNAGDIGQGWLNPAKTFNKTSIESFDSSYMFLFLCNGTNDLPLETTTYSTAVFKAKLLEIVDYANSDRGWAFSAIVLPTINVRLDVDYGQRLTDFNEAIRQIAELRGCIYIDLYTAFNALSNKSTLFDVDGLHLNIAGHRAVADIYTDADYTPYTGEPEPPEEVMIRLPFKIV